jgi:predicted small metal-binding protein
MMTKELKCGTVVPGCEFTVHEETDAELLAKIADHARAAHDIEHISESLRAKILAAARSNN